MIICEPEVDVTTAESKLAEVVAALCEWRTQKKSRWERMPAELLNRVRELRGGDVSDHEICKATGLSWNQLIPKSKTRKSKPAFVEIPPVSVPEPVVVEIHDGDKSVIIRFPSIDVEKLLSHFYI
jgi:hypothetical protein